MLAAKQIQQVIDQSLKGRQNAAKRAARVDARAALDDPSNKCCMESTDMTWHRWFGRVERMPVVSCVTSPMNPKRKLLTLACRHETWSARKSKFAACSVCAAARTEGVNQ